MGQGKAKLIYLMLTSLDGYTEDEHGKFGWAAPDPEVHTYVNELASSVHTYLYGRKMYDIMVYWETVREEDNHPKFIRDWARQWQAAEKIVYSKTITEPRSLRTQIERKFDLAAIRQLKENSQGDISVAGPQLAAHALKAGLVDEIHIIIFPVIVGGGKRFLPDGVRLNLHLFDQHRFDSGVVVLKYAVRS